MQAYFTAPSLILFMSDESDIWSVYDHFWERVIWAGHKCMLFFGLACIMVVWGLCQRQSCSFFISLYSLTSKKFDGWSLVVRMTSTKVPVITDSEKSLDSSAKSHSMMLTSMEMDTILKIPCTGKTLLSYMHIALREGLIHHFCLHPSQCAWICDSIIAEDGLDIISSSADRVRDWNFLHGNGIPKLVLLREHCIAKVNEGQQNDHFIEMHHSPRLS